MEASPTRSYVRLAAWLGCAWLGVLAVAAMAGPTTVGVTAAVLVGVTAAGWRPLLRLVDDAHHARHQLAVRTEELVRARDDATTLARAKDRFLANMSHELRTPLNAIVGYTELVLEDLAVSGPTEAVRDLRSVEAAAAHLLDLISGILDLTRLDSGELTSEIAPVDVAELVASAVSAVRPELGRGHHALVLDGPATFTIHSDPTLLRQVLIKLLSNAAKFTDHGVVRVQWIASSSGLQLEVHDSGAGIAPEDLDRVFERFEQVDPSSTRTRGGAGLGLAVTRRLVDLLGGTLSVKSELDVGTTFVVDVPDRVAEVSILDQPYVLAG